MIFQARSVYSHIVFQDKGFCTLSMCRTLLFYPYSGQNECLLSFGKPNKQLCSELMDDILRTGNFGRKISSSLGNLFVNKELDAKGKSRITAFFISVKEVVCSHWPKAKHNILILMAGTVVFPAKYLLRLLAGKRTKLHLISDYKEAKKQVELRRKLTDKE